MIPSPDLHVDSPPLSMYSSLMFRITFNADQLGGRPCVRGMRVAVSDVLALLAEASEAEILADYPYLEAEDLLACRAFAAKADPSALLPATH